MNPGENPFNNEAVVIFPHQLFKNHPCLDKSRKILLVEDQLFFSDFYYKQKFHKQKLILHRASMKVYFDFLREKGFNVDYIEFRQSPGMSYLFDILKSNNIKVLYIADPVDFILEKRVMKFSKKMGIKVVKVETPGFLTSENIINEFFDNNKYLMAKFYIQQRKRLNILVEEGKPVGGKWSFDPENRKKLPKNIELPELWKPAKNHYIEEAVKYVEEKFPGNPGYSRNFFYPVTYRDSKKWLRDFLENRLKYFGDYEDAISQKYRYIYHSLLTPMLNTGLLTPREVIDETLEYAAESNIPLNSLEGFIRQVVGWREFMRAVYTREGVGERNSNFWNHQHKIPGSLYDGTTGIDPVDNVTRNLQKDAYAHHIERLMILGNFLLLCEIHPTQVYTWFMEMFIDSYDWVMVPNVYGMSQYADGGLITTKPYFSSSNYIRKMSDYKKGKWCDTWDGLFWRFIHKHRHFFSKNYRMRMMVKQLERMGKDKLDIHLKNAEEFLKRFF